MIQYFKRGVYLLFCLLLAGKLAAQEQRFFVYIQSEQSQPFYVKYKGKLLSSSEKGYLIMPELPAGTLPITIGFPRNGGPEQQFNIRLGRNDQGFLLKKNGDNAYALYNLQTFAVIKPGSAAKEEEEAVAQADGNADAGADTATREMMASMQKDLETTFNNKAEVGPATRPVRQTNKFSETLDKVVNDDRPEDIPLETPAPAAGATAPVETAGAAVGAALEEAPAKRPRKKRKDRAPLTEEEQALLSEVIAEEHKAAAAGEALQDAAGDTAQSGTEDAPVKKNRKQRKKKSDPEFIEFSSDGAAPQAAEPAAATAPAVEAPAETTAAPAAEVAVADTTTRMSRKKRKKLEDMIDMTERPNNILSDSSVYTIEDRREARREKRRLKREAQAAEADAAIAAGTAGAGVAAGAALPEEEKTGEKKSASSLAMINSDCENLMDDGAFRKLLRRFVSAKDDEGMIDAFRRYTRNYCLETAQIRTLTQLVNTDKYRYELLDQAYPKTYDSDKFATLSSLLNDSYYQGRFKAMIKK